MSDSELEKLEQEMMGTSLSKEEDEEHTIGLGSFATKKIRTYAKTNQKQFFMILLLVGASLVFFVLILVGVAKIRSLKSEEEVAVTEDSLEIFSDDTGEPVDSGTSETDSLSAGSGEVALSGDTLEMTDDNTEELSGTFFVSNIIKSTDPVSATFQLGDVIYTLPVSISEFEQNGIRLITLGTLTPTDGEVLPPRQRDGYIQYLNERYYVRLANGADCDYHGLSVIGIRADDPNQSFIASGGYRIGDEEALISQLPGASVYYDKLNKDTIYSFGSTEGSSLMGNTTGRKVEYMMVDGKVKKIYLFSDGTVR